MMSLHKTEKVIAGITLALLPIIILFYSYTATYPHEIIDYFSSYVYYACFFAGGLFALFVAKRHSLSSRLGKSFLFIGLGMLLFVLGGVLWDYFSYYTGEAPYPTVAELSYLLVMPFIAIGVGYFIRVYRVNVTKWSWIAAIVAAALWYLFEIHVAEFNVIENFSGALDMATFTDFSFFISDSITVGLAVFLLTLMGGKYLASFRSFTIGFIVFGIANATFFYRIWNDLYFDGDISDLLFNASGILMTIGVVAFARSVERGQNMQNNLEV